jgi:diacylglycerol kinase (ATP)
MPKARVVYNPAAGRMPVQPFISSIQAALVRLGWVVDMVESRSGGHAAQAARQAAQQEYDAVFAVGGDGTVSQVTHGLIGTGTALGVIPTGVSNVWAREIGLIPFSLANWWSLRENAALLAESPVWSVDVGICNDQPFLLWAGMGLDALAVKSLEPRVRVEKFFSVPEYAASAVWNASLWHGLHMRLWADGKEVEGTFLLAVANNIRHYMGGIADLSPDGYLDDGRMDLWLFKGDNLSDAFKHAFDLYAGLHVTSDRAQRILFEHLRMEAESSFAVHMDGEPVFDASRVEISVLPGSLKVMVPSQAQSLFKHAIAS